MLRLNNSCSLLWSFGRCCDNPWCVVQGQQEELSRYQQRCQDTQAKNAALASEQQDAEKRAIIQLEELTRLQKQHEAAEAGAALRIAQLEQAASDASSSAQVHCCVEYITPKPGRHGFMCICKLLDNTPCIELMHSVARMVPESAPREVGAQLLLCQGQSSSRQFPVPLQPV